MLYTIELSEKQMMILTKALHDGEWSAERTGNQFGAKGLTETAKTFHENAKKIRIIRNEILRQKLNQDEDA